MLTVGNGTQSHGLWCQNHVFNCKKVTLHLFLDLNVNVAHLHVLDKNDPFPPERTVPLFHLTKYSNEETLFLPVFITGNCTN